MIWLNIKGFENEYQMSEAGAVRRRSLGEASHIVKSSLAANGKLQINLHKNGVRKNFMLHHLYAETFQIPVKTAMQILYEGYTGNSESKNRVRQCLLEKIQECEAADPSANSLNDDILYYKSFLKQLSE